MHPVLFKVGPFSVYSYGAMVALGFSVATLLAYRRAPLFGIGRENVADFFITVLVSGVIGARTLFVLVNVAYYVSHPLEIFNLSRGGLIWYGGFGAALAAAFVFTMVRKIDFWSTADLVAPYIALGQAFGRIGCFLNGCCYGIAAPAHFIFGDRQPAQIYSAILLLVIFFILLAWQNRRRFPGEILIGYCVLYSTKRFFIEFLRGDNPRILLGLTMSQLLSVAFFIAAAIVLKLRTDRWKKGS